jgi:glycosyltransferase involved in cell wall biosynthesis
MPKVTKVTVLMPVYDGDRYLREAIGSILSQTFQDFEVLTINDGFTDSRRNIILSYNNPRIRLVTV